MFIWNDGNLQRYALTDTVNDLTCQNSHMCCIQEAFSESAQSPLFDARGIQSEVSRDRTIMINSGGSGYKTNRKTHSGNDPFVIGSNGPQNMVNSPLNLMKNKL